MAASTLASSDRSLQPTFFSLEDNAAPLPREASFSSYLSTTPSVQPALWLSGRKKTNTAAEDNGLDVFGAEKYFGVYMAGDEAVAAAPEKPRRPSPALEAKSTHRKPGRATPSTCSETSCHSWSSLLRDAQKGPTALTSQKPASAGGKKLLGVFRCSCSGKASVAIDQATTDGGGRNAAGWRGAPGQVRPEFWCSDEAKRADCFASRQALYPLVAGNMAVAGKVFDEKNKPWVSPTTVCGAPFMGKLLGPGPRRCLSMMSPFVGGGGAAGDDDICSESSSDLFEIESISTSTLQFGGSTSMTCSAPSEASIEWSVVTASAANFSAMSEGELSPPGGGKKGHVRHQRPGGGLLLGCGSGKAVSISSNTHKLPEMVEAAEWPRHGRPLPVTPVIRYHPESPRLLDIKQGQAEDGSVACGIQRSIPVHKPFLW